MKIIPDVTSSERVLQLFFQTVSKANDGALLLDYDGTLAPFQVERDKAVPYPGVREILENILASGRTRVVLISGRWTRDLIPLLGLSRLPEIWGSHGWERLMPDGTLKLSEIDAGARRALAEANGWAKAEGLEDRCEPKPACLALHWRGLETDSVQSIRRKTLSKWGSIAEKSGLCLSEFDGGLELRVPGRNKGFAVDAVLSEMAVDTVVAYLGDDLTDEDAFKAIRSRGLGVLVREEPRPTAASVWLKPPGQLLHFLRSWNDTLGGRG